MNETNGNQQPAPAENGPVSFASELRKESDRLRQLANENGPASLASELRKESDKLQQLAEELQVREQAQQEMLANYPHFKQAVYALLREKFASELAPLPADKDLETLAQEEGAMPLETFLAQLGLPNEGP